MKAQGIKSIRMIISITFLVMLLIAVVSMLMQETTQADGEKNYNLYSPFIIFAPGPASFLYLGY